jgi:hypothetical protein
MSAAAIEPQRSKKEGSTDMATTSSNLVAGKALAGRGGNGGGQYGLKAKLLAGVAILGCAATLMFGGIRAGDGAQGQAQSGPVASFEQSNGVLSAGQQRFLEVNYYFPAGSGPTSRTSFEQMHFLEDNLILPSAGASGLPSTAAPTRDWATIIMIEQNQLPEMTTPAAPSGVGPQEYLPGEESTSGDSTPSPVFGPQP